MDRAIARLAERQGGVVSRAQLRRLGLGAGAVEHRLAVGRLFIVHRGVYAAGHRAIGARGRAFAALLAVGPGAVLSHASAGAVWGLAAEPERPHVTVSGRAPRSRRSLVIHRSALRPGELRTRHGLAVTSPARTLVDLAAVLGRDELERAVAEALFLRIVTPAEITEALRPGRRGAAMLARLVESGRAAPTRSQLERRFLASLTGARLPRPLVNERLGRFRVDFLWPDERVVVETDGWDAHRHRRAFEDDRARDAELQALGYRVVRFTWRQVSEEPLFVVSRLTAVLNLR